MNRRSLLKGIVAAPIALVPGVSLSKDYRGKIKKFSGVSGNGRAESGLQIETETFSFYVSGKDTKEARGMLFWFLDSRGLGWNDVRYDGYDFGLPTPASGWLYVNTEFIAP